MRIKPLHPIAPGLPGGIGFSPEQSATILPAFITPRQDAL